jgi:hypothetical protein
MNKFGQFLTVTALVLSGCASPRQSQNGEKKPEPDFEQKIASWFNPLNKQSAELMQVMHDSNKDGKLDEKDITGYRLVLSDELTNEGAELSAHYTGPLEMTLNTYVHVAGGARTEQLHFNGILYRENMCALMKFMVNTSVDNVHPLLNCLHNLKQTTDTPDINLLKGVMEARMN